MNIQLHLTGEDQSTPLTKKSSYNSALKDVGINFVERNPDFVLIHASLLTDEILSSSVPLVILERTDSTNLIKRKELKLPQVIGIIKNTILRPKELHNEQYCHGRYHNRIVKELIPDVTETIYNIPNTIPNPIITKQEMNKIHVGYSFCHYQKLNYFANTNPDFEIDRSIDLHFVGTTDYDKNILASYHRTTAINQISKLKNIKSMHGSGRHQKIQQYIISLLNTKIVLSPWGHGEACYRDFEALFCGCVLLKPDSDFVESWPDIYQNNKTYIPCKADFSDLQEKVDWIQNNWNSLKEFRYRNRELVIETRKPENFAKHMKDVFSKCSFNL